MENKRKALGKGLEALFNAEPMDLKKIETDIVQNASENDIVHIPISEIRSNPYQPRQYFDQTALEELAQSIKEHGIIEPIIVKKAVKGYELIAGERRTKASKLAGFETVAAIIKDFTDQEMMDIALIENIQREDLSPVEVAEGFKKYIDRTGATQEEMAQKFGKSRSYITNLLGLLTLPKSVRDLINHGKLSTSHARVLSKMNDTALILSFTDKIISEDLSVRELEKLASGEGVIKRKPIIRIVTKSPKVTVCENILRDAVGTKVVITKNKITIPFDSEPDLMRILEILNVKIDNE